MGYSQQGRYDLYHLFSFSIHNMHLHHILMNIYVLSSHINIFISLCSLLRHMLVCVCVYVRAHTTCCYRHSGRRSSKPTCILPYKDGLIFLNKQRETVGEEKAAMPQYVWATYPYEYRVGQTHDCRHTNT